MCFKVDIKEVYIILLNSFLAGEKSGEELKRKGQSEDGRKQKDKDGGRHIEDKETGNEKERADNQQQIDTEKEAEGKSKGDSLEQERESSTGGDEAGREVTGEETVMIDERAGVSTCQNELDPAKYKNKTLNEEEKYSLLNNKWVTQNHNYPQRKFGQRLLRYSNKWEDTYPWLRYSVSEDSAYCAICMSFGKKTTNAVFRN